MIQLYAFVLTTVPVHETSLASQHFYSTLLWRREGYVKSTLCMLVKLLEIMDGPLGKVYYFNMYVCMYVIIYNTIYADQLLCITLLIRKNIN